MPKTRNFGTIAEHPTMRGLIYMIVGGRFGEASWRAVIIRDDLRRVSADVGSVINIAPGTWFYPEADHDES